LFSSLLATLSLVFRLTVLLATMLALSGLTQLVLVLILGLDLPPFDAYTLASPISIDFAPSLVMSLLGAMFSTTAGSMAYTLARLEA
jgi:hypothetical protein